MAFLRHQRKIIHHPLQKRPHTHPLPHQSPPRFQLHNVQQIGNQLLHPLHLIIDVGEIFLVQMGVVFLGRAAQQIHREFDIGQGVFQVVGGCRNKLIFKLGNLLEIEPILLPCLFQLPPLMIERQVNLHASQHLFQLKRLAHIIGSSQLETMYLVHRFIQRTNKNDGDVFELCIRFHLGAHLKAVHFRHHNIEQD